MAINQKNFSERLRYRREELGLSRLDFAKKLGLTNPSQISRYESGKSIPGAQILIKIAEILEIDLHWLLLGKPSPGIERWRQSYAELVRITGTYIAWDNMRLEENKANMVHELMTLRLKESQGEGVGPLKIQGLEEKIKEIEERIRKNIETHNSILARIYDKELTITY
jgi:transcriptional regulator with XRE-family HTH domain